MHDAAARLGITLISVDRPGVGDSDPDPQRTLEEWPSTVRQIADAHSLSQFAVIGVSGGGPYALETAADMGQRLLGLFLMSPMGPLYGDGALDGMVSRNRAVLKMARNMSFVAPLFIRFVYTICLISPRPALAWLSRGLNSDDRALTAKPQFAACLADNLKEVFRSGPRGLVRELEILAGRWEVKAIDSRIPVHIWHGDADYYVPLQLAQYIGSKIPNSTLKVYEGRGHFMAIELLPDLLKLVQKHFQG